MRSTMEYSEKDWQIFKKRLPIWQDFYIKGLLNEYSVLINGEGDAAEKFWALKKAINKDVKSSGVFIRISRSTMMRSVLLLLRDKVIEIGDLDGFSDELINTIKSLSIFKI